MCSWGPRVEWPGLALHFRNGVLRRCGEVKEDVHDGPQPPPGVHSCRPCGPGAALS